MPALQARSAAAREEHERRLNDMRHLAAMLRFKQRAEADGAPEENHSLVKEPLLHFTGADRGILDGTLWAYGRDGRPVALLEIYCGRHVPAGMYRHAWTAICDRPMALEGASGIKWTPQTSAAEWTALKADAPPAPTSAARLRQFRILAKRFHGHQIFDAGTQREELRLLTQPLYRYHDAQRQIRDAAMFAFAMGTNPEALLFIEARDEVDGQSSWYFGLARRGSSAEIHVLLDDEEVWSVRPITRLTPQDPFCHFLRSVSGDPVLAPP